MTAVQRLADGVTVETAPALPRPNEKGVVKVEAVIDWVEANYRPAVDQNGNPVLLSEQTRRAVPMEAAAKELRAKMWTEGRLTLTEAVEKQAFGVVSSLATHAPPCVTALRSAMAGKRVWLDIGDAVYTVTADGWAQETTPDPARPYFLPASPIPAPVPGGSIEDFATVLGLPSSSKALRLMWLWAVGATALQREPTPILWLIGEPNSAKSLRGTLTASLLHPIGDPKEFPTKQFTDDQKLALSKVPTVVLDDAPPMQVNSELSKQLTRLVTGMQVSRRVLYTNSEMVSFSVRVPTIVTSIYLPPGLEQDNLTRVVPVSLPKAVGRTEGEVRADFARLHGRLLGAILDTLAVSFRTEITRPETLSRLGEFHLLARRMQVAEGRPYEDDFLGATQDAQMEAAWEEPLVQAIIAFMAARDGRPVSMPASEWLDELGRVRMQEGIMLSSQAWPTSPTGLGSRLAMRAGVLKQLGIEAEQVRRSQVTGNGTSRQVRLWRLSGTV